MYPPINREGIFKDKKYSTDEVLDFYTRDKVTKNYDGEEMKMNSQRYMVFKFKGCTCVECGRVGTHFKMQKDRGSRSYHFGLWSDDGVQMTKDHIIPKSKGGRNALENYQTMCEKCNVAKGSFQEGTVNNSNEIAVVKKGSFTKIDEYKNLITNFQRDNNIDPYQESTVLDKEIQYMISCANELIKIKKGKFSKKSKILNFLPSEVKRELIKDYKLKYEK